MKHRAVAALSALATAALLTAAPRAAQQIKLPETLTWTAYDVGSGGYNQAVAIGNALKNKLQINLRVLPGKNDVSRTIPLREGRVPFSANGVGGSYLAQEGVYEFGAKDWGPQPVRALIINNSEQLLSIVTAKDANILTPKELKGKRVAWVVGSPSLNQNITAMLAFAGLTWADVKKVEYGGFGQAMEGIIANQVDAAFSSSISGLAFKIASSPRGLRYPVFAHDDKEGWARMKKVAPFFVPTMGAEGAELSQGNKVESASYPYPVLMAYKAVDAELVYNMTRAMVELFDEYKAGAPDNTGWDVKRQVFDWVIPVHDGAIKYFKEKGLWKSEHDAHNAALIKRQDVLMAAWAAYKKGAPDDETAFAKGWMKARAEALTKAGLEVVQNEW